MQMADAIAAGEKDVLVIALEMAAFELMAKSISRLTTETAQNPKDRKTVQGILQGTRYARYSAAERQAIDEATAIYSELAKHLYFKEGIGNIGVEDVRQAIKRHKEMTGEAGCYRGLSANPGTGRPSRHGQDEHGQGCIGAETH